MSVSANHHYVPQGILRNFCFEGERVNYFSKRSEKKGIHERNIQTIFKKRQLNSYFHRDGTTTDHLEQFFSVNFDDQIVKFVEKYESEVKLRDVVTVSVGDHKFFVQCLYNLMKRTPEFHETFDIESRLDEIIPSALEDYQRDVRSLSQDEIATAFNPEARRRIVQNARIDVLRRQAPEILNLMATRKVCFAVPANPRKSFIVGSNPVVRLSNNSDLRLDTGDVELWATFSPRLAIGLLNPRGSRNVLRLADFNVRHINLQLHKNCFGIASHSRVLLESLIDSR